MNSKIAILVAGGNGSRMQSEIPKQFLSLAGKPILVHTIERFLKIPELLIILVLPEDSMLLWLEIKSEYFPNENRITETVGGKTRFQSVKNGLATIEFASGLVAVHDAVRPLIGSEIIVKAFDLAQKNGSAVVCVNPKDSLRKINQDGSNHAMDRSEVKLIQTPQIFKLADFKLAYQTPEENWFTDDASVLEHYGVKINLLEGEYSNIKITTPEDLQLAEIILKNSLC